MEFEWLNSCIADETIELVLVFNEKGDILFGNQSAVQKLEYDKEELIKCSMMQIFRQDFLEGDNGGQTFEKETLESKKETAMYRKNSSCFPVNIHIIPSKEAGIYVLMAEDISRQKDMNARIRKLKEEEQENQKARNEFTANVTHELRTPVNGIRGHVTTLLDQIQDEEQRKTLDIILYCCDNMSAIINNILDFAKLESGKFTIDEKEFDFYKMMDRVIATHSAEINKKELRFSVDVDEKIPRLMIGDELRIVQILNNLMSNAIKFTMVGYINIVVSKTSQVNDEIELFFMVRDSGIGISQAEKDRLFQSFSQVDASITRRFGGTGLGLAITKQLIEMMQGSIHLESEKGKGSTFSFSVKLKTNQSINENNDKIYGAWANFAKEEDKKGGDVFTSFGEIDKNEELKKRMDKLVLSIELSAWDKAEMLAATIKTLIDTDNDDLKKQVLRMEMAIRKSNYEKSMDMYEKVKKLLSEQIGEI